MLKFTRIIKFISWYVLKLIHITLLLPWSNWHLFISAKAKESFSYRTKDEWNFLIVLVKKIDISVASQKRGKLCHLISIQSTHFVQKQENVRVLINFRFCDTTVLLRWSLLYMAAVGFSFPTMDTRCSLIFADQRLLPIISFMRRFSLMCLRWYIS